MGKCTPALQILLVRHPPVLWPRQPAVEAVVIGPFGIEWLGVGVYVQFKKIFGHILTCIFGLFGFLSWLFLISMHLTLLFSITAGKVWM